MNCKMNKEYTNQISYVKKGLKSTRVSGKQVQCSGIEALNRSKNQKGQEKHFKLHHLWMNVDTFESFFSVHHNIDSYLKSVIVNQITIYTYVAKPEIKLFDNYFHLWGTKYSVIRCNRCCNKSCVSLEASNICNQIFVQYTSIWLNIQLH